AADRALLPRAGGRLGRQAGRDVPGSREGAAGQRRAVPRSDRAQRREPAAAQRLIGLPRNETPRPVRGVFVGGKAIRLPWERLQSRSAGDVPGAAGSWRAEEGKRGNEKTGSSLGNFPFLRLR